MFRSYDHLQGAYIVPCKSYSLKTLSDLHRYVELVCGSMSVNKYIYLIDRQSNTVRINYCFLSCNFCPLILMLM